MSSAGQSKKCGVGAESMEHLDELLQQKDVRGIESLVAVEEPHVRLEAARALGRLRDPGSVPALVAAMGDEQVAVRWAAAKALSQIGPPAVPALIETLRGSGGRLLPYSLWALGEIGNPEAISALSQAVRSPLWEERWSAVASLSDVGGGQVCAVLVEALGDRDERVRKAAGEALQKIGEPSLRSLRGAVHHPDGQVRDAAAAILVGIGTPEALAILRQRKLSLWIPVIVIAIGALLILLWLGFVLVNSS